MRGTCKHGNPLTNSCAFCRVENRKADPPDNGRPIPRANSIPLPKLQCRKCGYTTPYGDVFRRHTCDATRPTTRDTAQELIDGLSWEQPKPGVIKGIGGWLAGLRHQPKPLPKPQPVTPKTPVTDIEEKRIEMVEDYLLVLCNKLGIKTPFLFFADEIQNEGACGEAGQSTIWLHRESMLTRDWPSVQRWIRHEVAHILVHNTPEWREAPAHGAEFDAALVIVEKA